jgi:ribosomal protein S18 acetylase RimI-like enzyme
MPEIRYTDCDAGSKRRVGDSLGEVAERHVVLTDGFTILAMNGDTPVGLVAVYEESLPAPLADTREGFINIIEVAREYRRQGIGRRLAGMAIDRCRSRGLLQVRAWSSLDKAEAIAMWKALGFALCPATEHPRGQEVRGYFVACRLYRSIHGNA